MKMIAPKLIALLFSYVATLCDGHKRLGEIKEHDSTLPRHPPPPYRSPPRVSVGARGIWAYQHGGHATLGTHAIVENYTSRTTAIDAMNEWSVRRFYGSYGNLQTSSPGRNKVARWNQHLHYNGFSTQLLLGEPHHHFPGPECRGALLDQIQTRLIDFHSSFGFGGRHFFDTLHLNVEPQGQNDAVTCDGIEYPPWPCSPSDPDCEDPDGPERARRFYMLYQMAKDVRNYLDWAGVVGPNGARMRLEMDLAFWIDSSTSIHWEDSGNPEPFNSPEGWYTELDLIVDGVTLMTYHEEDVEDIKARASQEREWMSRRKVRVALNPAYDDFLDSRGEWVDMAIELDTFEYGSDNPGYAVDLFHYKGMMELPE